MRTLLIALLAFACTNPPPAETEGDCMLPTSRDATIDGSSPIPSAVINKLQDCVTGRKLPTHWRWTSIGPGLGETNIAYTGAISLHSTGVGAQSEQPVRHGITVGDQIYGFGVRVLGTGGAAAVVIQLNRVDGLGSTLVDSFTINNPPNSWNTYTHTIGGGPEVVADAVGYELVFLAPIANIYLGPLGIQLARL